ncbi:MAG TPA: acetate--CoA ligase family protein [Clostridia bacterium]|nr:acetate--CoA ligase family protein [Clostridia bacterium]
MDVQQLDHLFNPQSIAIVGASANPLKPGGQPLISLLSAGYGGRLYPVNPRYQEIHGLKCYPSLTAINDSIDLAIISVPARDILAVMQECVDTGVKTAIIFTSGFAEIGPAGKKLQEELLGVARRGNIRFAGPNCLGIVNAPAKVMANFAVSHHPEKVVKENAYAFISQSGGFGTITYSEAQKQGLGAQILVSTGNEADLSFTDFLNYMIHCTDVKAIGAYLEGVRNGKEFCQIADAALAKGVPLIILKVGKHQAAAQAAQSHTGSMVGNDDIYQGFFDQKGIIRITGIEEIFPLLHLFADRKFPRGKRIGILSTSGGGSVYLADLCVEAGLEVAQLSPATRRALESILPSFVTVNNPVDLTSQAMVEEGLLKQALDAVLQDPNIDLLLLYFNVAGEGAGHVIQQLEAAYLASDKPMMCIGWSHDDQAHALTQALMKQAGLPNALQVEHGVRALAALANYAERHRQYIRYKQQDTPVQATGTGTGRQFLAKIGRRQLTELEAKELLKLYDIPVTREAAARSAEEAARLAEQTGFPVALKILSPDILHKTEVGGVRLNLNTREEVLAAYEQIMQQVKTKAPQAQIDGVLVAEMVPPGREMILGIKNDVTFGNVLIAGMGGIFVEVLRDFVSAVPPLARYEAEALLARLKSFPVLKSFRNLGPADMDALIDMLVKLSRLALDLEGIIEELEINPLIVGEQGQGVTAVDALVTLKSNRP